MSSSGFTSDRWEFRKATDSDPGGWPLVLLAVDLDGDEYRIGALTDIDVAGHLVTVHNATLTRSPIRSADAVIDAVLALHSPPVGWEATWRDPVKALLSGWPPCAGCTLKDLGFRDIAHCRTLPLLPPDLVQARWQTILNRIGLTP